MNGAQLIAAERTRQIEDEGYKPEHDDEHVNGEMVEAACCYIRQAIGRRWLENKEYRQDPAPDEWPWDEEWWNPQTPERDLVKAGALIAAELDRQHRQSKN